MKNTPASLSVNEPLSFNAKQLSEKLEALRQATKTVGFSVAVVQKDKVVYAKGFGYRDLDNELTVDADTLFPIGSVSKAFTAGLLGIMVEEKGLDLNDSPRNYLPNLIFSTNELNNSVTILDMIGHRTGLPRHDASWYLFPTDSRKDLLARVQHQAPFTEVRTHWYYNNFMYLGMGLITESLTGKSWEENIQTRFFEPLKMPRSNLDISALQTHKNIAKGYKQVPLSDDLKDEETQQTPYFNIAAISPAGSINSSANELANWVSIWLNQGQYNGVQVLPESYINQALAPLMLIGDGMAHSPFPKDPLDSYGYAWFHGQYKGHYRLEHGGNIDGFAANVGLFPHQEIGIIVLSNQEESMLPALARNLITDELLGLEKTDWVAHYQQQDVVKKERRKKAKTPKIEHTQPSHPLLDYIGSYHNPAYGKCKVTLDNEQLKVHFTRQTAVLKHHHFNVFTPYLIPTEQNAQNNKKTAQTNQPETVSSLGFNLHFQDNEQGEITLLKMKLEPMLESIAFTKVSD